MKTKNENITKRTRWNNGCLTNQKQLCILTSFVIALSGIMPQIAQACYVIIVPTFNVTKVTITTTDPVVCGTNCLDSASATVNCPGFGCNKNVVIGCPSRA